MKKVLLVLAITCVGFVSQAQVSFGVKAGGNLYNLTGDDADNIPGLKSRVAYHLGGFANIHVSDMFSVQPELLYSAQGAKVEIGDETGHLNLDYINIPVMLQYNNASGFFAEVGPEVGFLISAKSKGGGETQDIKDSFKGINFSAGLGAGYITHSGFGFGARYNFGLSNILDSEEGDLKNSGFRLSLIYRFGGGASK